MGRVSSVVFGMLEAALQLLGNTRSSGPEIKQRVKLTLDSMSNRTAPQRCFKRRMESERTAVFLIFTHLSSIGGGENPHGPSALFDVPEKPEGRHLVGLRGHVHVDKQGAELEGGAWDEREEEGGEHWGKNNQQKK